MKGGFDGGDRARYPHTAGLQRGAFDFEAVSLENPCNLVRVAPRGAILLSELRGGERAIGEHIYHPDGEHARIRNAVMGAKSQEEWFGDLAWLYGGTGLTE